MTPQDKELTQLHNDIIDDTKSLINKYMCIVGVDVAENDEPEAKRKIIALIKQAIEQEEKEK